MRFIAFISLVILTSTALGQASYKDVKPVLIVRLAENITWPDQENFSEFNIGIYGADSSTYEVLSGEQIKIREKSINASWVSDLNNLDNMQVLYVDQTTVDELEFVSRLIENKSILLISEHSSDPKSIMINLTYHEDEGTVSFQINRANIIIEGFEINPELLLLGGTEVDIRQLVREMKKSLEELGGQLEAQKDVIADSQTEIDQLKEEIESKTSENEILSQMNEGLNQQIRENEILLSEVSDSIRIQQLALNLQSKNISDQMALLEAQKNQLEEQNRLINERTSILDSLAKESKNQKEIITDQSEAILSKENLIELQTRLIYISIIFILLISILGALAFRFYRKKVSFSARLSETNKKLIEEQKTVKEAMSKLEKTQDKLVQSEKMAALGVLTAGVAHEINNPAGFIKSGVQVLKKNQIELKDSNLRDKVIANIELGVSRITDIVKSLNSFSRGDHQQTTQCRIHEVLDNCLTILNHEYKNRVDVEKNYSQQEILTLGNESQLYQVFTNLISNAIQSIDGEGKIEIFTGVNEKWNLITIKDTGSGISSENLSKIFDPFFTTKDPGIGTGLGLSIVYNIIEEQKGKIKFESSPGIGTNVQIRLKRLTHQKDE